MFCPSCGSNEQTSQFCRACGTDLRTVRTSLERPDSITASAVSAREDIGRAVAEKIRQVEDAHELKKVAEDVLPQIEKFLESPDEKRLRRMREGGDHCRERLGRLRDRVSPVDDYFWQCWPVAYDWGSWIWLPDFFSRSRPGAQRHDVHATAQRRGRSFARRRLAEPFRRGIYTAAIKTQRRSAATISIANHLKSFSDFGLISH